MQNKLQTIEEKVQQSEKQIQYFYSHLYLPLQLFGKLKSWLRLIFIRPFIFLKHMRRLTSIVFSGLFFPKRRSVRRDKKILMLTLSQIDIDPRINKVAQALARHAYEVDILCFKGDTTDTSMAEELILPGIRYVRIPRITRHRVDGQFFQDSFVKAASSRKFDYVHANDLPTLMSAWYLSRKFGVPLIYDAHEMWTENVWLKKNIWGPMPWYAHVLTRVLESFLVRFVDLL